MEDFDLKLELLVSRIMVLRFEARKNSITSYSSAVKYAQSIRKKLKNKGINSLNCAIWKDYRLRFEEEYGHCFNFLEGYILTRSDAEFDEIKWLADNCPYEIKEVMIDPEIIEDSKILE